MNPEINNEAIKLMRGQIKLRLVGTNLSNCASLSDKEPVLPYHLIQIVDILRKTKDSFVKIEARHDAAAATRTTRTAGFISKLTRAMSGLFRKRR